MAIIIIFNTKFLDTGSIIYYKAHICQECSISFYLSFIFLVNIEVKFAYINKIFLKKKEFPLLSLNIVDKFDIVVLAC